MPGPVVCETALCQCMMGDAPTPLSVTSQELVMIDGMLVATIADCIPDDNIVPFGTCATLTAAALGVPTPCVPAPVGTWEVGSIVQTINGIPVLLQTGILMCGIGGEISIVEPMNTIEVSD